MKHKCTSCGRMYENGAAEILEGCVCGHKLFYFVNDRPAKKKELQEQSYFYEFEDDDHQELIVFDLESIRINGKGKYEIDLNGLLQSPCPVYQYSEGKYSIDIGQKKKK